LRQLDGPVRVLDLCCGGGGVGLALPPFKGEMVGVDINDTAVGLARLAAGAQGLSSHSYHCGDAGSVLNQSFDLVVGNPPSLPPELGGQATLFATGSSTRLLQLLDQLLGALTPRGRALLTVFSTAAGRGREAPDELRTELATAVAPRRRYRYAVRRQFPLAQGRWLRHVALELLPQEAGKGEEFSDLTSGGVQLPGLIRRRAFC
jgi:SAM-dependent methyltransferase